MRGVRVPRRKGGRLGRHFTLVCANREHLTEGLLHSMINNCVKDEPRSLGTLGRVGTVTILVHFTLRRKSVSRFTRLLGRR